MMSRQVIECATVWCNFTKGIRWHRITHVAWPELPCLFVDHLLEVIVDEDAVEKGKLVRQVTLDRRIYDYKESQAQAEAAGELGKGDCPSPQTYSGFT